MNTGFKYSIPEMELLLSAAADLGFLFTEDWEKICLPHVRGEETLLLQRVSVRLTNDNYFQLSASTSDIHLRKRIRKPKAEKLGPKTIDLFKEFDEMMGHRDIPELKPRRRRRLSSAV